MRTTLSPGQATRAGRRAAAIAAGLALSFAICVPVPAAAGHTAAGPRHDGAAHKRSAAANRRRAHAGPIASASRATQSCPASWFSACWRPYSASSPFNLAVPAGAAVTPDSAAVVAAMMADGPPNNLLAGPTVGHQAVYYVDSTAPLYTVHCTEPWGTCKVEGVRLRIPARALPAPNDDHHMVVIDANAGMEYDFWQTGSLPPRGGALNISWGGKTSLTGLGLGSNSNAAELGGLAGVVRAGELLAGHIDHALVLSVNCDSGKFVWPALQSDQACPDGSGPAMGARLQLDMSAGEISALPVATWKKAVLQAFATYGAYVEDTGNDPWTIRFESGQTYTSMGQPNPWLTLAQNNAWPYWAPDNDFVGDLGSDVPWNRLRVIAPCVAQQTC
jgi:hypothetical protein